MKKTHHNMLFSLWYKLAWKCEYVHLSLIKKARALMRVAYFYVSISGRFKPVFILLLGKQRIRILLIRKEFLISHYTLSISCAVCVRPPKTPKYSTISIQGLNLSWPYLFWSSKLDQPVGVCDLKYTFSRLFIIIIFIYWKSYYSVVTRGKLWDKEVC